MKKNWIIGGLVVLAGLLLVIVPEFCVKLIVILFGLAAIAEGIYGITIEQKICDDDLFQKTILYRSIGNVVVGVLAVVMPLALAGAAWSVMTYVLAIYLIIAAAIGFYASSKLKGSDVDRKQITLENFLILAAGVILVVIGPETLAKIILRVIGIAAILVGGFYLFYLYCANKKDIVATDVTVKDVEPNEVKAESEEAENEVVETTNEETSEVAQTTETVETVESESSDNAETTEPSSSDTDNEEISETPKNGKKRLFGKKTGK